MKTAFAFFFLLTVLGMVAGCDTKTKTAATRTPNNPCYNDRPNNDTASIIIYKEDYTNADLDSLHSWGLHKIQSCPCDSNLQLWGTNNSSDIPIFGHDGLANNSDGKQRGAEGGPITALGFRISPNYILRNPDPTALAVGKNVYLFPGPRQQDHLIGVMDTRLASNNVWNNSREANLEDILDNDHNGLVNDIHGWNFAEQSAETDYRDGDHPHGTMVTHLLERELQVPAQKNKNVKYGIVPMVVLGKNKEGRLFNMICAMAYATQIQKLKVINASLGYYGHESRVLELFIHKLKEKKIILVAAAGNADSSDVCETSGNPRNLNARKQRFYPASYSRDTTAVIAATTIYTKKNEVSVAPDQNYSNTFVDVGVMGDRGYDFKFNNMPGTAPPYFWREGSSYAAPIATAFSFLKQTAPPPSAVGKSRILSSSPEIPTAHYKYQPVSVPIRNYIKTGILRKP